MRSFEEILAIAAKRKGGVAAVLGSIAEPLPRAKLAQISDDRWLSMMTKCIFRAGFNWSVVERKWDDIEIAFDCFAVGKCALMDDAWFDALVSDRRIIRNGAKIQAVQQNAVFVGDYSSSAGGFGSFVGDWPDEDYVGLVQILRSEGSRLGGTTGQYFLRSMGKDSFILTRDVVARLVAEGVIDKQPNSKRALQQVQRAFNEWREQSDHSFNVISRVLAQSVG